MKKVDLINKRFGRLIVIKFAYVRNKKKYWLCECDCGKDKIVRRDHLIRKEIRSCGCLTSLVKIGNKNPMWNRLKENITIGSLHSYISSRKEKKELCEECGKKKKLELANIKNHNYTRNIDDYKWMCDKCHVIFDDRLKYLELGRIGNNYKLKSNKNERTNKHNKTL